LKLQGGEGEILPRFLLIIALSLQAFAWFLHRLQQKLQLQLTAERSFCIFAGM
jgi:hypothetical protein